MRMIEETLFRGCLGLGDVDQCAAALDVGGGAVDYGGEVLAGRGLYRPYGGTPVCAAPTV
jgi:hypothetical protein